MVAACWSPAMPQIAIGAAEQFRHAVAELSRGILDLRQHRARHPQDFQQFLVPVPGVDVEQQRARGIGGVGGMHLASGQPPQQIAIDRAEQQFAARRALARAGHVIEDPGNLGAGEIGIDDQPGPGRDRRLVALGLQPGADIGGAAVLPDDGAVDGVAGGAVPHHGGFALVGDADRGNVLRADPGLVERLAAGRDRRGPDILGLVLDPAGGREMLREFLLRGRRDRDVAAKHNGARGGGALIDGQHKGHGVASPERFASGVCSPNSSLRASAKRRQQDPCLLDRVAGMDCFASLAMTVAADILSCAPERLGTYTSPPLSVTRRRW